MVKRLAWVGVVAAVGAFAAYEVACVSDNTQTDPCPKYCQDIAATCSGTNAQYADDPTCLRVCAAIEAGTSGSAAGDTIACRAIQQSNAKDELDSDASRNDCINAGVSSAACAGTACQAFCNVDLALCGPQRTGYATVADCVTTCATWGQNFVGAIIGSTGNTLECRTYHLQLSQTGNATDLETHCPHTGAVSVRCFDSDAGTDAAPGDAATDAPGD